MIRKNKKSKMSFKISNIWRKISGSEIEGVRGLEESSRLVSMRAKHALNISKDKRKPYRKD